jgi:hypothetical protein
VARWKPQSTPSITKQMPRSRSGSPKRRPKTSILWTRNGRSRDWHLGAFREQLYLAFPQGRRLMLRVAARYPVVGVESVSVLYRQRTPSKDRADYFWKERAIVHWRPRHLGVGWVAFARFDAHTRGLFALRFCEDAAWCAEQGSRRDAIVCLSRALRISPPHTVLRLRRTVWATLGRIAVTSSATTPVGRGTVPPF